MMVREKKVFRSRQAPARRASLGNIQAPVRGLVLNESLASGQKGTARVLDNWLCTTSGIAPRRGSQTHATLGAPVRSLFRYEAGGVEFLFAATDAGIYDVTAPADPDVTPAALVENVGSGDYAAQQFGTAGGNFMLAVNGAAPAQIFDGSTWAASGITGVDTATLSHVWSYANRLFFVQSGTMKAWYLGIDAITGAASEYSFASVFRKGGSLLFGATWSLDAGDGLDDKCVFVTTEGEVAVFEGTNPSDPADWRIVGLYEIGRPLGKSAVVRTGGDVLIGTDLGMVPLSQAIRNDASMLTQAAVSNAITPLWSRFVQSYQFWAAEKWPKSELMLVTACNEEVDTELLACNMKTGAWSRLTNLGSASVVIGLAGAFVGSNDGKVRKIQVGGSDDGLPYSCIFIGGHEDFGAPVTKTFLQARAQFRTSHDIAPLVSAQMDYAEEPQPSPAISGGSDAPLWDSAVWDQAVWNSAGSAKSVTSDWRSIGRTGYVVAPEIQLSFGSDQPPSVELVAVQITFEPGELVT